MSVDLSVSVEDDLIKQTLSILGDDAVAAALAKKEL